GVAFTDTSLTWQIPNLSETRFPSASMTDGIAGFQVGLQHQWGRVVAGVELSYTGLNADDTEVIFQGSQDRNFNTRIHGIWAASARLGYSFDRLLAYAKAGVAGANVQFAMTRASDGELQATSTDLETGYIVGGGL